MGAFEWLSELMRWLGKFIPRPIVVRYTHAGVKFKWGHTVVVLNPGVHVYFPLTTDIEIIPVARQTIKPKRTQSLMTKDGQEISIGLVVKYCIDDIEAALAENYEINDTIEDVTSTAATEVIVKYDFDFIHKNLMTQIQPQITESVSDELAEHGVRVKSIGVTDFTTNKVYKILGDANVIEAPNDD